MFRTNYEVSRWIRNRSYISLWYWLGMHTPVEESYTKMNGGMQEAETWLSASDTHFKNMKCLTFQPTTDVNAARHTSLLQIRTAMSNRNSNLAQPQNLATSYRQMCYEDNTPQFHTIPDDLLLFRKQYGSDTTNDL
jgi:hypothetical protein